MLSDCPSVETLAAALTGTLSAEEFERVAAHVNDCAGCRAVLELVSHVDPLRGGEEET